MDNNSVFFQKQNKIIVLFIIFSICFFIFILILFYWTNIDRRLPSLRTKDITTALRGSIYSDDNFTLAFSQKLYKVSVDTRNIHKDQRDIFISLYSRYMGVNPKEVKKRLDANFGTVVLSYKLNAIQAQYARDLSKKLHSLGVFSSYEDPKTGIAFLHGMSISESGEQRVYPYKDIFAPALGYVKKIEEDGITKVKGVKGLEGFYEERLRHAQNSKIIGSRDVAGVLIYDKDSLEQTRIDGAKLKLGISLSFQKKIEHILDRYKEELEAKEIVAAVMRSDTGQILAFATSNRFDPQNIKRDDYGSLNPSGLESAYEPGSVMKSFVFAILLEYGKTKLDEIVNTHGGSYSLAGKVVKDEHPEKWMSSENVLVHSSNIGMIELSKKLDSFEYYQGLRDFGFSQKTGIDMPYESIGNIPSLQKLQSEVYKATVSYGYGLQTTFMQVLRAYNVFNNKGYMVTPYIVKSFIDNSFVEYDIPRPPHVKVISELVSKQMFNVLVKAIKNGTGKNAFVNGVVVGGKTGTAHIAVNGQYENIYNGSFFGFANDESNRYTIGILTMEPKKYRKYFGAQSAAPIFKSIVLEMIESGLLIQSNLD